jgi:hypothetical protein
LLADPLAHREHVAAESSCRINKQVQRARRGGMKFRIQSLEKPNLDP